jgi:hypothetical protein
MTDQTPVMTNHARERCAEMGISTKVAKRIWRERVLTWVDRPGSDCHLAFSSDPDYGVVYTTDAAGRVVIVTVVFRTSDYYVRRGVSYEVDTSR